MPRIALATYEDAPDLAPDDQLLVPALAALGASPRAAVWSDPNVDWTSFDAVVIRSCWNYHLRIADFHAWLTRLEDARIRVLNSPDLVRWNSDKRYLLDLARRGVATIPTMVVRRGDAQSIAQVAAAEGWSRVVVKPAISASGYETYLVDLPLDDAGRAVAARVTSVGDTLVQPFAPEVPRDGEFSLTFIDGVFSHATIKRATRDEFRVQTEHGGSVDAVQASPELVAQATRIMQALPETPLYARVDGISRDGAFLLMELELIEPNLFLEYGTGAVERMARGILRRI